MLPEKEYVYTQIEALIHHFKLVMEGIRVPAGEIYVVARSRRTASWAST